jgi:hypothetical protein
MALKLMFQALEHVFQGLEFVFQALEYKILRGEETFSFGSGNFFPPSIPEIIRFFLGFLRFCFGILGKKRKFAAKFYIIIYLLGL